MSSRSAPPPRPGLDWAKCYNFNLFPVFLGAAVQTAA